MKKTILMYLFKYFMSQRGNDKRRNTPDAEVIKNSHSDKASPANIPRTKNRTFSITALVIFVVLLIGGTTELINATNVGTYISNTWNSVLSSTPQKVIEQTSIEKIQQTTVNDAVNNVTGDIQQKTVGDGLNAASSSIGSIIRVLLSPLDVVLGMIILLLAVAIRSKRLIGNYIAKWRNKSTGPQSLSWVVLALSLAPSLLDYFVF